MKKSNLFQVTLTALAFGVLSASTSVASLAESAEKAQPIGAGKAVPEVTLKTADGKDFVLKKEVSKKPSVLIFYRGGWCPYCMRHLSAVQEVEKELTDLGFQVLAISPDSPETLSATSAKQNVKYTLLSDAGMAASDAFGLAFALDSGTVERYKEYGIKLTAAHEGKFWLPVPAVYITDKDAKIAFAHTNPDYRKRLSSEELIGAARKVMGNSM